MSDNTHRIGEKCLQPSLEDTDLGPHAHQRAPLRMPPGKEGIMTRTLSPKPEMRQKREGSEEAKNTVSQQR